MVGQGIEQQPYGQGGKAHQQQRLAAPAVGQGADQQRHRDRDQLGGDDGARQIEADGAGTLAVPAPSRAAAGSARWQNGTGPCRRPAPARGGGAAWRASFPPAGGRRSDSVETARPLVVDRRCGNGQDRRRGQHGEHRHEIEHGLERPCPADEAGHGGGEDVAGTVAGGIAGEAAGQVLACHQAYRDGRDGRGEHRTQHRHDGIGREHDRHGGCLDDGDGSRRQCPYPTDQERPLVRRRIDEDADRGMQRDPDQSADGQHQADRGLVPVRLAEQEDADIGPEPTAHVGEQEIDQIETAVEGHGTRAHAGPASRIGGANSRPRLVALRSCPQNSGPDCHVPGFCRSRAMPRRCLPCCRFVYVPAFRRPPTRLAKL